MLKVKVSTNKYSDIIIQRGKITAYMTLALSIMALFASIAGVFEKSIYGEALNAGTITEFLLVGSVAQDITFIPLALLLMLLSVMFLKRAGYKTLVTILGLVGNFFYGYGLYVMQGQYTSIYLIYLAVFSLSLYSMIFGLLSFTPEFVLKTSLPRLLRKAISIFLFSMVVILGLIWIIRIMPGIIRHVPTDTYAVFVLDLGIVFPAVAITAVMLMRNKSFGNILAGIALFKTFTVCLSWGFGEWYGRLYGSLTGNLDMLIIPGVLTLISAVFFVLYLLKLKKIR
ncbi:MAG: hypothetical protein K0S71_1909 [Clostridia bacterium]|jgi:hypothetical protein|nr:hypothetical protein [Clostridia bacterium]